MSMYVRVKRLKTTLFLHVEPTETVLEIKQKVQALTEQPADEQRLVYEGIILEDAKTLAENKVGNDAVLAVTHKIDDETNTWEEVNISIPGAQD
mmetsp:Transcript_20682/g.24860  ORF Transcript_20682/g.24860 Transcript_20682/m.24860 type:complete len:94 (-) Transcript_20682:713-994(-)|eukprot:CAMPEP_0197852584 /NCGR_PEP_ID=MMETSP1438-20131217/20966_1 /TAXON_ID=1461541 /ORGANISM="Pterosperma sp., Strain CCMP1384" /LENGTH=93 /DNA_ID=CAMNT_0043466701 /DNA_START=314 /DNA_END=595 /DNA_ORIENTATION=+